MSGSFLTLFLLKILGADARFHVSHHVVLLEEGLGAEGALIGHELRIVDLHMLSHAIKLGKLFVAARAMEQLVVAIGGLVVDQRLAIALHVLNSFDVAFFFDSALVSHSRLSGCVCLLELHELR